MINNHDISPMKVLEKEFALTNSNQNHVCTTRINFALVITSLIITTAPDSERLTSEVFKITRCALSP